MKAIFIIEKQFADINDLDNRLRQIGHNLEIAGCEIGKDTLLKFGIKDIKFINKEYFIETNDGDFYVKDFNDIRYDFLEVKVRSLNGDEHQMFKRQIDVMLKINGELKPLVW